MGQVSSFFSTALDSGNFLFTERDIPELSINPVDTPEPLELSTVKDN